MSKRVFRVGALVACYASLMVLFAFYDLDISLALYDRTSLFGKIFETIAEVPFTFIALSGFTILLLTRDKTVKWKNIVTAAIASLGMLAYGFLMPFFVLNYLRVSGALLYGFALMLPNCAGSYFLYKFLCKRNAEELKTIAIIAVATILCEQALVTATKYAWGPSANERFG